MDPIVIAAVGVTAAALVIHVVVFRRIFAPGRRNRTQALLVTRTWDGAPARPDERVSVTLIGTPDHVTIDVDAPYHGDPPPDGPPGPREALWEHEVVEVFFVGDADRYTEVELGPHGHHLVLRLDGVRQVIERALPLVYRASADGVRWRGEARLPRDLLPRGDAIRVNAYAIHGVGQDRRHLALTPVPGDAPDFHAIAAFTTTLAV